MLSSFFASLKSLRRARFHSVEAKPSATMYSKKGALAIALIFCLFETALSIKCYSCVSTIEGDCYKNPKDYRDCDNTIDAANFDDKTNSIYTVVNNQVRTTGVTDDKLDFVCGTYTGVHGASNLTAVVRMCINKITSCNEMKMMLFSAADIKVDVCENCTTDYCNSSSSLKVGSLILGFSLLFTILLSTKL